MLIKKILYCMVVLSAGVVIGSVAGCGELEPPCTLSEPCRNILQRLEQVQMTMAGHEEMTATLENRVSQVDTDLVAAETHAEEIASRLAGTRTRASELGTEVNRQDDRLGNLDQRLGELASNVANHGTALQNMNTTLAGHSDRIATMQAESTALDDRISQIESALEYVPAGSIIPHAGEEIPTGWSLCDGRELDRFEHAELFAVIRTSHGAGNGFSTFNIPDYRGRFVRGVNHGANQDPEAASRAASGNDGNPGNAVGSVQDDAFREHTHPYFWIGNHPLRGCAGNDEPTLFLTPSEEGFSDSSGGDETRPVNACVYWIIKHTPASS